MRPEAVKFQRGQFLASAGFTGEQHRAVDRGVALQRCLQPADHQRLAHQRWCRWPALAQRTAQHPVLAAQARTLHAALEGAQNLGHAERLEQEVAGTRPQGLDGGFQVGKGGDQDHLAGVGAGTKVTQPVDAAAPGQRDVDDGQVKAVPGQQRVGLFGRACAQHLASA